MLDGDNMAVKGKRVLEAGQAANEGKVHTQQLHAVSSCVRVPCLCCMCVIFDFLADPRFVHVVQYWSRYKTRTLLIQVGAYIGSEIDSFLCSGNNMTVLDVDYPCTLCT